MELKNKGQGSIEYLLLLAAAIVVVAVVISFMITTIQPAQQTGSKAQYDYLCNTLDTNSLICGCYLHDPRKGDTSLGAYTSASSNTCQHGLPGIYASDPLLTSAWS